MPFDAEIATKSRDLIVLERAMCRVEYDTNGGCWLWSGYLNEFGYAIMWARKTWRAARFFYQATVREIPKGFQVDHLCRVRSCVNPAHLQAVSQRANILRGVAPPSLNAKKTHCPRGHELTRENTVPVIGPRGAPERTCRKCRRIQQTKLYRTANPEDRLAIMEHARAV